MEELKNITGERVKKLENLSKDLAELKLEVAKEKALWNEEFGDLTSGEPMTNSAVVPKIIEAYEQKMQEYVTVMAQAQGEKRDSMRRKIAEKSLAQQLEQLKNTCSAELGVLEKTSMVLQDITVDKAPSSSQKPEVGGCKNEDGGASQNCPEEDSDSEWEWNFEDASENVGTD